MNKVERNFIKKIINEHLTRYLRISYIFNPYPQKTMEYLYRKNKWKQAAPGIS